MLEEFEPLMPPENSVHDLPENQPAPKKSPEETKRINRTVGVGVFILGAILSSIFLGWPTYQVHHGADSVTIYTKPAYGGLFFIFYGLILAIFGMNPLPDSATERLTRKHWIFFAVWLAIGLGSVYLTNQYFASLGYTDPNGPWSRR